MTGEHIRPHTLSRWVTHSPTLGKHNAPSVIYMEMFILTDLINIYVLESISSRIWTYFNSILCLWNHMMCLRCFVLMCKLKWDFDYSSSFFQRVGIVKRSCYNQNIISVFPRVREWVTQQALCAGVKCLSAFSCSHNLICCSLILNLSQTPSCQKCQQGKSEGFDSCDRPSNLTQIGFKSSIFQSGNA